MNELKNEFLLEIIKLASSNKITEMQELFEGELAVMSYLLINDDVSATNISNKFEISKARVTAIITSLIKKNYVYVIKNVKDARILNIKLTKEGSNFINEKLIGLDENLLVFLNKLGNCKSKQLIELLRDVNSILSEE